MVNKIKIVILFLWAILPSFALADSIGQWAESAMEPVAILSGFVNTASAIAGACLLLSATIKYRIYRTNPLAAPISNVITSVILGILLILLPLVHHLTASGLPYNYFI